MPSSGAIAECDARPCMRGADAKARGCRLDVAADRTGVVEHVSAVGVEHRAVKRSRSDQATFLADGEHQLHAGMGIRSTRACGSRPGSPSTAALLSAPTIDGVAFRSTPVHQHGLEHAVGGTVSRWAHRRTAAAPGRRRAGSGSRGCRSRCRPGAPAPSARTSRPSDASSAVTASPHAPLGITRAGDGRKRAEEADRDAPPRTTPRVFEHRPVHPPFPLERRFSCGILPVGGSKSKHP